MEKIKNWFNKHKKIIDTIVSIITTLWIFLAGVVIGSHMEAPVFTHAEEVDSSMTEEEWLESLNDVQPPSILFNVSYVWGELHYPLLVPSFNGSTSYASSTTLFNSMTDAEVDITATPIDGLQGYLGAVYSGLGDSTPTYIFTLNDIYTRFTDTFEWGYIEVSNSVSNVTYDFEIYDFKQYEFEHITYNMALTSPSTHIPISPTDVLNAWGHSQDPYVNPFQYFLVIPNHEPVAYIKSMTVSFVGVKDGEEFGIHYTGNLNMDARRYLDALQFIGDNVVIEEIDALFVFRSIVDSVDSFMSTEILPNFSFYDILYIAIGIPLTIWLLKLWLGG